MPQFAAVAASGTTYDDALSTAPLARPAVATLLSGATSDRSGVRDNIHDALPESAATLAQGAKQAGFETAAFVSSMFVSYPSGFQRGFDLFDGPEAPMIGPALFCAPAVPGPEIADHFRQWLASRSKGKPFFVWIHLGDLNCKATPPPGSAGRSVPKTGDEMEDYDAALKATDDAIGAIFAAAKADPDASASSLVIVGTHAPYLGESGRRGESFWLADETLRVPLVTLRHVSDPAATQPKHDPRPTWLPDLTATLNEAVGARLALAQDAIALDAPPPAGRLRLAWTYAPDDQLAWPPLTAVKEGANLAVFATAPSGELRPLGAASEAARAAAAARPALPRRRVLPDASRTAIEKRGFSLGQATVPPAPIKDPDSWLRDLQIVRVFVAMHRPGLAGRNALRLIDASPDSLAALETRLILLSAAPAEESWALRKKLLALYPDRSDVLHWSAHTSLLDKAYDVAGDFLDAAIAVGPVEAEMYYDRACVYALTGKSKEAIDELSVAIRAGYRNWDWFDKDPDLGSIRSSPEFVELLRTHGR